MDAAKKKALFRAKLNAQKKHKRIDSPLVRYNESEQPVCRVCDVVLKSELQWDAHQASRKHHEAINYIKANAANVRKNASNGSPQPAAESTRPTDEPNAKLEAAKLPKHQPSSGLPPDFFDNRETKTQKSVEHNAELEVTKPPKPQPLSGLPPNFFDNREIKRPKTDGLPGGNGMLKNTELSREFTLTPMEMIRSETKKPKGALPESFFDNKEADLLARGIKPVKPDVKDEYKEFEKLIQEDLLEVDNRLEEDEIDAAEMIEEAESLEQKAYRGKVELLRKKKMELMAARLNKGTKDSEVAGEDPSHEDSSSDDDSGENFAVDWRAQHL